MIRPAVPNDVPAIAALVDSHARRAEVLPRSVEAIRESLKDWVVGVEDGEVVACGSLLHYSPELSEVRSLVVDDRTKGNGWGSAMVRALITLAEGQRIPTLFALTRAVPFFQKLGFSLSDRAAFPEKIWRDCQACPIQEKCDETAVAMQLSAYQPHVSRVQIVKEGDSHVLTNQ